MTWSHKRVLVPLDLTDESIKAVDVALDLVADPCHVWVLHVIRDVTDYAAGLLLSSIDDENRRIDNVVHALRKRLAGPRYASIMLAARIGDPGSEIAAFAEARGADLIVIPSHGRKGVQRLLMGSVSERVVRLAHCPVLVLKPAKSELNRPMAHNNASHKEVEVTTQ